VRPTTGANAWIASLSDKRASLTATWEELQTINEIIVYFDNDYDHPMETVQYGHPEDIMPFCVRNLTVKDANGNTIAETKDNHSSIVRFELKEAVSTDRILIEAERPLDNIPISLFEIIVR
jgi:hypothetical protein